MATTHKKKVPSKKRRKLTTQQKKKQLQKSQVIVFPSKYESIKHFWGYRHGKKRFYSPEYQLEKKRNKIESYKRKLGKGEYRLTPKQTKILAKAKRNKAAIASTYTKKLDTILKERGYFKSERNHAKNYTVIGKIVEVEKQSAVRIQGWNKDLTKAKVNGRWITEKTLNKRLAVAIKEGRIKGYQKVCGLTKKEAQAVYDILNKETKSAAADKWRAILY